MPFDRNNAADLAALKSEVETDPANLGYSAVVTDTSALLALLNEPANNPGSETGAKKLILSDLLDMIFQENIASQDQFRVQLLFEQSQNQDDDVSKFKARLAALDTGLANLINANTRPLSRAEALFGDSNSDGFGSYEELVISRQDWFAARDS